jgi:hypothetical protein
VKFATREQLAYWCKSPSITVFRRLTTLEKAQLVSSDKHNRPNIWTIKNLAASVLLSSTPSGGRRSSWSVMAHACHANEVEIMLDGAKDSKGFRFLDRATLFKRGLNPGHGEHGGTDDAKRAYLVLLDDYMMKPERIGHTWTRAHHPPRKFFDGNRQLSWSKIVNHFIVATTDEFRAAQHAAWLERHEIPARVITIKALWS